MVSNSRALVNFPDPWGGGDQLERMQPETQCVSASHILASASLCQTLRKPDRDPCFSVTLLPPVESSQAGSCATSQTDTGTASRQVSFYSLNITHQGRHEGQGQNLEHFCKPCSRHSSSFQECTVSIIISPLWGSILGTYFQNTDQLSVPVFVKSLSWETAIHVVHGISVLLSH